ncbi:MAG: hypothetical protein ABI165_12830 [Bryobacteraceae bacterium]
MRIVTILLVIETAAALSLCAAQSALDIVRHSVATNAHDWTAVTQYDYRDSDMIEKLDVTGHMSSKSGKTYDVLMIDGSPYKKLVSLNGVPLGADGQARENVKLQRAKAARAAESSGARARRIARFHKDRQADYFLMNEMVHAFNFVLAGRQVLNGRDVYVLEARPRPGYRPPSQKAKVLTGMQGKLFIDARNYHWARVEAEVTRPVTVDFIANVSVGTKFEFEQQPEAAGVWLPARFTESTNATVLGFKHYRTREVETFSNYRPLAAKAPAIRAAAGPLSISKGAL